MTKDSSMLDSSKEGIHPETFSTPEPPLDGMMAEERRTQILQIVRSAGRVKVNELAVRFNTSAVTIRNDLNDCISAAWCCARMGARCSQTRSCANRLSTSV